MQILEFFNKMKKDIVINLYPILIFTAVILTGLITPSGMGNSENVYLLVVTLEIIAFVIPSIIYCHLQGFDYAKGLELKIPELGKLPVVISAFFAMISMNVIMNLIFVPSGTASGGAVSDISGDISGANVLGVVIALAIIPAICEEFVFRSVLMRDYNKYGAAFSVIMTSVLFAMIHFDISRFPIYFAGGVILGLSVYITRSVLCSILIHSMYNVYGIFFEKMFWSSISKNVNLTLIVFMAISIFLVSLLVFFSEAQRIFIDYATMGLKPPDGYTLSKGRNEKEKRPQIAEVFPAIAACLVIFIIYTIVKG